MLRSISAMSEAHEGFPMAGLENSRKEQSNTSLCNAPRLQPDQQLPQAWAVTNWA